MMTLLTERTVQLDNTLDKIAESLALTEEQWRRMETSYKTLYEWLKSDDGYFKRTEFEVYPQGSVRIGTAIKPFKREDFDLDLVVHLLDFEPLLLPLTIFNRLKNRLEENPAYKGKLEPKNRCMRINIASDYHMDVLPGCQLNAWDKNRIRIPDRELDLWVFSNPRGYAEWFLGKVNLVDERLMERALKQEKVSKSVFMGKPLQRSVQLIKRFRDIYFEKSEYKDYATSSIVLTTIFATWYTGEESIFETMDRLIESIRNHVIASPLGRLKVLNPVDANEDFTDSWENEPNYYEAFKAFSIHVYEQWQVLKRQPGMVTESRTLSLLAGDSPVQTVFRNQAENISFLKENGHLNVNRQTGNIVQTASASSIPVQKHTFFGV
jgi:Second Messenger Oligonucleotide or Dinucleotide Synthetase domain